MTTAGHLARRIDQALGRNEADLVIRRARYLNIVTGTIERGDIAVCDDTIVGVGAGMDDGYRGRTEVDGRDLTVVPGFIDTHMHVESTMMIPDAFARCVLPRGTTTVFCDPHEIANVLGVPGVRYFLDCAERMRLDLRVMLSSCVPSTHLETAGAQLNADDLQALRDHPKVGGLAEMMNFPGLLAKDPDVLAKLAAFSCCHIDGHAPLLTGRELNAYLACGVSTEHECTNFDEAQEKLGKGMRILMREGSLTRNLATLVPLLSELTSPFLAFCTDDRNPLNIADEGHMDYLIRRAIALGAPAHTVYRAASWSAARIFGLSDRGLIAPGQRADLVLLNDLETCAVHSVIQGGRPVEESEPQSAAMPSPVGLNSVRLDPVDPAVFAMPATGPGGGSTVPVIGVIPNSIVTEHQSAEPPRRDGVWLADPGRDLLKVCVLARHGINRNVGRGFVRGFGFPRGALASSVGHDSHNIIVVGDNDDDMAIAVNRLITLQGGFVAVCDSRIRGEIALPVAGLMSLLPLAELADSLRHMREAVRAMGCPLDEPFLQLAFLPLPVVPHLKITDRGLVDVDRFQLLAA